MSVKSNGSLILYENMTDNVDVDIVSGIFIFFRCTDTGSRKGFAKVLTFTNVIDDMIQMTITLGPKQLLRYLYILGNSLFFGKVLLI